MWNFVEFCFQVGIFQTYEPKTNKNVIVENKINGVTNDVISKNKHLWIATGLHGQLTLFSHHFYHPVITVSLQIFSSHNNSFIV